MATGRAVTGAVVTVGGLSANTDATGRYAMVGVSTGPGVITVTATGYSNYTTNIEVTVGTTTVPDILLADSPPPPPAPPP